MVRYNLLFLLILSFVSALHAEVINGQTNFFKSAGGTALIALKPGIELECSRIEGNVADISEGLGSSNSWGEGNTATYTLEIFGYVLRSGIRASSIPENALDSALKSKSNYPGYDELKGFLKKQGYSKEQLINTKLPKVTEYCIYESTVVDPSPGYRTGLIFENNKLIAIEHSRPLKTASAKEYSVLDRNKLFMTGTPTGMSVSNFVKKINEANMGAD